MRKSRRSSSESRDSFQMIRSDLRWGDSMPMIVLHIIMPVHSSASIDHHPHVVVFILLLSKMKIDGGKIIIDIGGYEFLRRRINIRNVSKNCKEVWSFRLMV